MPAWSKSTAVPSLTPKAASVRALLGLVLMALAASALFGAGRAAAAPLSPDNLGVNVQTDWLGGQLGPGDLSLASGSGLGVVRSEVIEGTDADSLVALAASANLRLAPMLGLAEPLSPDDAATAMAGYVTSFAERYGPNGSFWSENPQLPYLPVETFEIGNEPNIPLQWVADETNLHWADPSSYAEVYEAARTALHQVDPSGVALVGGLADSGDDGVDLAHDEEWLAALTPGTVDAVGFHPYTFPVSFPEMYSDTEALRQWMNANGMQDVPIDVNEIGACDILPQDILNNGPGCEPSITSGDWGTWAAGFTEWSLCSQALDVGSLQPEYWGDLPDTDINAILPLVSSEGTLTPYGQDYLGEAESLTTNGCPLSNTSPPAVTGAPVAGQTLQAGSGSWAGTPAPSLTYQWEQCDTSGVCTQIAGASASSYQVQPSDVGYELVASVTASNSNGSVTAWSSPTGVAQPAPSSGGSTPTGGSPAPGGGTPTAPPSPASMVVSVSKIYANRHKLTVTVRVTPAFGSAVVVAKKRRRRIKLHPTGHAARSGQNTVLTFVANLSAGHWTVTVTCTPPAGYAGSRPVRRVVTIR